MDQTRFTTALTGDQIIREFFLRDELQAEEGTTFELALEDVAVRFADEVADGSIVIIVERRNNARPAYTYPNGDDVLETRARLKPGGESFSISLTLPYGESNVAGARVTVSSEMERIILEYIAMHDADS